MAEGIAIGLDGMRRGTVVGTRMAGLNGGVFNLELPSTKIGVAYPGERLNHVNGTPREDFVPSVLVEPKRRETGRFRDAILEAGYREILRARDPT
jgi:carboxyl-terminal processing protease